MNANARAWVAALRSGDYQQGQSQLHGNGKYCCLGVACDLAIKAGVPVKVSGNENSYAYDGNQCGLPESVRDWLGVQGEHGSYIGSDLACMNDDGMTFDDIASLIESEPEGLFNGGD